MTKRKRTSEVAKRNPGDLFPADPSVEESKWVGNQAKDFPSAVQMNFNQNINFFGEIQGFDNLEKLSPEIRSSALQYLEREQSSRLQYVASDQRNSHILQQSGQTLTTKIQALAMILAATVFVISLGICAYLLINGQKIAAVSLLLAEIATAVGMIIYGHRIGKKEAETKSSQSNGES